MSMKEWAEREVEIACKREAPDRKEGEWDYGCACYESALKAYKSLLEDGHSGASFGFTKQILQRLCEAKPLTPIIDTDDIWGMSYEENGETTYQCTRMSSLFKKVDEDGNVTYKDVDRYYGVDIETGSTYGGGGVGRLIDDMFPITMPYYPGTQKYRVETSDILTDRKNGDLDTMAIWNVRTPGGEIIKIFKFYKSVEDGWEEISKAEWADRKKMHEARIKREEQEGC